jgi:hypothetical protein
MGSKFGRTKKIDYWFQREDGDDVDPRYEDALEDAAMERITSMIGEGYTAGELVENIRLPDDESDDGVAFRGWWSFEDISE